MDDTQGGEASPWVKRWAALLPPGSEVLDLACGGGRHSRFLAACGYRVEAVDRDAALLAGLAGERGIAVRTADLEEGPWPYAGRRFSGIVVTNYLFRPRLAAVLDVLDEPGVLIYETFMIGNERFGKPSNPAFLLRSQELLALAQERGLRVIAYEEGEARLPHPAMVQRICAMRGDLPGRI